MEIKESIGKNSIEYIVSSIESRKTKEKKNGKTKAIQR